MVPAELRYTKDHELIVGDGRHEAYGQISSSWELPESGRSLTQ